MTTIEHELRTADARGVSPPQNWTTRAADEIAALRKDAERYRWLRAQVRGARDERGRQEFDMPDPHPLGDIMRGSVAQHFDAAVDAAMAPKRDGAA